MSSILRSLLFAALIVLPAAAEEGQASGNVASADQVLDQVLKNMPKHEWQIPESAQRTPGGRMFIAPREEASARVCSIPLLEMPLPRDKRFNTPVLPLPRDTQSKDVVPLSAMPAPPCPQKHD